jgi:hypothetical protein
MAGAAAMADRGEVGLLTVVNVLEVKAATRLDDDKGEDSWSDDS